MVQLTKELKIKCVAEPDYFPKEISKGEWYDVVGIVSTEYNKTISLDDGSKRNETVTVIKFLVINDKVKLQQISSKNCDVICKDVENKKA